jgi:hypothetical protein
MLRRLLVGLALIGAVDVVAASAALGQRPLHR